MKGGFRILKQVEKQEISNSDEAKELLPRLNMQRCDNFKISEGFAWHFCSSTRAGAFWD